MTLLGGTLGGDMRRLLLVHIVRIVVTVVSIPLILHVQLGQPVGRISIFTADSEPVSLRDIAILALCAVLGLALSRLLRFPSGTMIFALILRAAAHVSGLVETALPPWVSAFMQVIVGSIAAIPPIRGRQAHALSSRIR